MTSVAEAGAIWIRVDLFLASANPMGQGPAPDDSAPALGVETIDVSHGRIALMSAVDLLAEEAMLMDGDLD